MDEALLRIKLINALSGIIAYSTDEFVVRVKEKLFELFGDAMADPAVIYQREFYMGEEIPYITFRTYTQEYELEVDVFYTVDKGHIKFMWARITKKGREPRASSEELQ